MRSQWQVSVSEALQDLHLAFSVASAETGTHVLGATGMGSCDHCQMDEVQSQSVGKIFLLKTFQSEPEMFLKSGGQLQQKSTSNHHTLPKHSLRVIHCSDRFCLNHHPFISILWMRKLNPREVKGYTAKMPALSWLL